MSVAPTISLEEVARVSPYGWLAYASNGAWLPYPWLEIVDYWFRKAMDKSDPVKRIALSAPPQHGKSYYSCVGVPSYTMGKFPEEKGILVTHSGDLAEDFGSQCRSLIEEHGKQVFNIELDPTTRAKKKWSLKGHRGTMQCVGGTSGISGKSADWAIYDDPFPNYKHAQSATFRQGVWNFYLNDLRTRMSKDAWMVLLQTRWNDDDLIGRIKKNMSGEADEWVFINLPAVAKEDETFPDGRPFRKIGDPLCPELKPLKFLQEQENILDPALYASLYQCEDQRPEGVTWGSEHFPEDIWVDEWPKDIKWSVMHLDPALGKDAKGDDYQAVVYIGVRGGKHQDTMPRDVFYVDADIFHETVDGMLDRAIGFMTTMPRLPLFFSVESTAFQQYLVTPLSQRLVMNGQDKDVYIYGLEVSSQMQKIMRIIHVLTPYVTKHKLKFIRSKGSSILVQQLRNLGSAGTKKDGPDALAGAMTSMGNLARTVLRRAG